MDEIKKLFSEIIMEIREIKESYISLKKDNEDLKEELRKYQRKMEEENKELRGKVKILEEKMKVLGNKEKLIEKKEKKNNIIISGKFEKKLKEDRQGMNVFVKELCENLVMQEVIVEEAQYITTNRLGIDFVRAKINSFDKKLAIMKNKYKLARNTNKIFIDDDLTEEERKIQSLLRKKANEEKAKGNKVKIGYKKISINNRWTHWNDLEKTP